MPTRPGPWLDAALARGLIHPNQITAAEVRAPQPGGKSAAVELVAATFSPPGLWVLPIETSSEANGREWRKRSSRTQAARKAVSVAFGKSLLWVACYADHYHRGGVLRVALTRLGGRKLDRSNLPAALKATEDAVAMMLGADDGDPRWQPAWEQEPGGAAGVRVALVAGGAA